MQTSIVTDKSVIVAMRYMIDMFRKYFFIMAGDKPKKKVLANANAKSRPDLMLTYEMLTSSAYTSHSRVVWFVTGRADRRTDR